jgi:ATP-dependent helicase/nuclease subunit A
VAETAALKEAADATLAEEYWRRLYVAMTRAEDELYVTGTLSAASTPEAQLEGSWYQAIEQGLMAEAVPLVDASGASAGLVYPAAPALNAAMAPAQAVVAPSESGPLALKPVPPPASEQLVSPSGAAAEADRFASLDTAAEAMRDAEAARLEGLALHALLQHLVPIAPADRALVAPRALEVLLPNHTERHAALADKAMSILARPDLVSLFGPDSRAELPFRIRAHKGGEPVWLTGRMDRIVVDDTGVLVVDYKSDSGVPETAEAVSGSYLTQLGLYALVAGQLFPGRPVRAAILWTELESLMILPPELLSKAQLDFTLR